MPLRMAVHLHLHYTGMWPEFAVLLQNIGHCSFDLYVTLTENHPETVALIKSRYPNASVWVVENRGYDIGPFVDFLHKIDLAQYDLVMKLHSKNKGAGLDTLINGRYVGRKLWFKLLTRGLLGSRKLFKKNIRAFEKQPDLGMIGSKHLITSDRICSDTVRGKVGEILAHLGYPRPQEIKFVAGTMFIVRARLLAKIKNGFSLNDFSPTDGSIKDGTVAHALERVFGCLVAAEGFRLKGFDKDISDKGRLDFLLRDAQLFCRFMYYNKMTKHNYRLIKIMKLPVYHRKTA